MDVSIFIREYQVRDCWIYWNTSIQYISIGEFMKIGERNKSSSQMDLDEMSIRATLGWWISDYMYMSVGDILGRSDL